jgi:predicted Zn-dependent protease
MRASFFWLCTLSVAACATHPVAENSTPLLVSEAHEITMGRDLDRYLVAIRRFYDDSAWEHYVQQLGMSLVATCDRPGLPWTFRVLDDSVVNAVALPGGFVYVTRGMLVHLNSEAQLAAVLGHEVAHVSARHVGDQSARREMERRGLVVGTSRGAVTEVYGDVPGTRFLLLANSREDEQEADDLGLRYMSDAGYDPAEMVAVLRMFVRDTVDSAVPEWLATHPSPEHRIEHVSHARATMQNAGARVERDAYLARVAGLPFGPDRRKGYLSGSRFVVPALGYQVTFPRGWTYRTDGVAVRGESPSQDAVVDLAEMEQPTADSAAHVFFTTLARPRGSLTHDHAGGVTLVSAAFAWMPYWVKVRGSVTFIEGRGRVDRVMGVTRNPRWSAYRWVVDSVMRTIEPVPDSELQLAQPLRVATVSLQKATSLAALARARPAPVELAALARMNQVPLDSVLPAGDVVKWVVDPRAR